jgi:hypothetical protein
MEEKEKGERRKAKGTRKEFPPFPFAFFPIKAAQLRSQYRHQCHDTQRPALAAHFAPVRR